MCITTFYFGRTAAAQYVNLQCSMMAQTYWTVAVFLLIVPVFCEIVLNDTGHVVKGSVYDGELGVARSSVYFDRQLINGGGPVINGHNHPVAEDDVVDKKVSQSVNDSSKFPVLEKDVVETQQTTCQVTTEQLAATAQATVTRVLKGLCTTQELEKQFHLFTEIMTDRMNQLNDVLVKLDARVDDYNQALRLGKFQQIETLLPSCAKSKPSPTALSDVEPKHPHLDIEKHPMADVYENDAAEIGTGARDQEIEKYNSTIHIEPVMGGQPKKVFTYYWKIPNANFLLTGMNPRRSLRSQSFYIYHGGYRLYLRSYPRQNEVNFSIHVGLTKGDFDQVLKWPFPHKMRVAILDQTQDTRSFEDLSSRIWDPSQLCSEFNWQQPKKGDNVECVGLGLPIDVLRQRDYISFDNLVIKLTVYLDP